MLIDKFHNSIKFKLKINILKLYVHELMNSNYSFFSIDFYIIYHLMSNYLYDLNVSEFINKENIQANATYNELQFINAWRPPRKSGLILEATEKRILCYIIIQDLNITFGDFKRLTH